MEDKKLLNQGNKMANYLACTRKMALIIGSNLFVHAGFTAELVKKYKNYGIDDINKLMALYLLDELKNPNNFKEDFMVKENSPLWTRTFGNINMSNETCERLMRPLEEVYKIDRIYVGHTPQLEKELIVPVMVEFGEQMLELVMHLITWTLILNEWGKINIEMDNYYNYKR